MAWTGGGVGGRGGGAPVTPLAYSWHMALTASTLIVSSCLHMGRHGGGGCRRSERVPAVLKKEKRGGLPYVLLLVHPE